MVLVGSAPGKTCANVGVEITGRYRDESAVEGVNALAGHIAWLPSVWPETYSYTLSVAFRSGLPVAAFDIGAIARRLRERDRHGAALRELDRVVDEVQQHLPQPRLVPDEGLIRARVAGCVAKGFAGVDFDNVDGFANQTGFLLAAADQLRFNRWLAAEAHRQGLAVGVEEYQLIVWTAHSIQQPLPLLVLLESGWKVGEHSGEMSGIRLCWIASRGQGEYAIVGDR